MARQDKEEGGARSGGIDSNEGGGEGGESKGEDEREGKEQGRGEDGSAPVRKRRRRLREADKLKRDLQESALSKMQEVEIEEERKEEERNDSEREDGDNVDDVARNGEKGEKHRRFFSHTCDKHGHDCNGGSECYAQTILSVVGMQAGEGSGEEEAHLPHMFSTVAEMEHHVVACLKKVCTILDMQLTSAEVREGEGSSRGGGGDGEEKSVLFALSQLPSIARFSLLQSKQAGTTARAAAGEKRGAGQSSVVGEGSSGKDGEASREESVLAKAVTELSAVSTLVRLAGDEGAFVAVASQTGEDGEGKMVEDGGRRPSFPRPSSSTSPMEQYRATMVSIHQPRLIMTGANTDEIDAAVSDMMCATPDTPSRGGESGVEKRKGLPSLAGGIAPILRKRLLFAATATARGGNTTSDVVPPSTIDKVGGGSGGEEEKSNTSVHMPNTKTIVRALTILKAWIGATPLQLDLFRPFHRFISAVIESVEACCASEKEGKAEGVTTQLRCLLSGENAQLKKIVDSSRTSLTSRRTKMLRQAVQSSFEASTSATSSAKVDMDVSPARLLKVLDGVIALLFARSLPALVRVEKKRRGSKAGEESKEVEEDRGAHAPMFVFEDVLGVDVNENHLRAINPTFRDDTVEGLFASHHCLSLTSMSQVGEEKSRDIVRAAIHSAMHIGGLNASKLREKEEERRMGSRRSQQRGGGSRKRKATSSIAGMNEDNAGGFDTLRYDIELALRALSQVAGRKSVDVQKWLLLFGRESRNAAALDEVSVEEMQHLSDANTAAVQARFTQSVGHLIYTGFCRPSKKDGEIDILLDPAGFSRYS
uniref:Uncharacterized protein n=1 Tax=Palpitomonas bilix TaxID=652834 RepID=A0A7S3CZX3_9EUKA|mmetsp:Transcript_16147/g.40827  ORF Transcript_16147/g.40827 Transcript_16147/m.40827 type:complete len:821 (+) Transcript_16147:81-2543(+)